MKKNAHITLDDIAKRLDVSRVTVSKALRGHPDISEATVKRVRKVAGDLGYSPNMIARNLSARRSQMLGVVVPKIAHFFFSSMIEAVYNTAFDRNYETILTVSQENPEREKKHLQTLVSMRVDGIIISVSNKTSDLSIFSWIHKMGIPLLFVDRMPEPAPPGFCAITVDDHGGAMQAVEQAIRVGYTRIACMGGDVTVNIGASRLAGYRDALKKHGLPVLSDLIVPGGYATADGYNGFKELHRKGELPECIFAVTYPVALGVYEAAKETGVRIPEDVDIICFGDSDVGKLLTPALSCVSQPAYELGKQSVLEMLACLDSAERAANHRVVIPTELVLRETCVANRRAPRR